MNLVKAASNQPCASCREFLDLTKARVPWSLGVHIIMYNYSTHRTALIRNWSKRPRFHVHFTATYGSWLNLVERCFAELTTKGRMVNGLSLYRRNL